MDTVTPAPSGPVEPARGTRLTPGTPQSVSVAPRVSVCVRVRPVLSSSSSSSSSNALSESVLDVNEAEGQLFVGWQKCFRFDHVWSGDASQECVYQQAVQPALRALFQGVNATIFAYGQTGTGKTFTMGTDWNGHPGKTVVFKDEADGMPGRRGILTLILGLICRWKLKMTGKALSPELSGISFEA